MAGLSRDHNVNDPLDRIEALEAKVRELERSLATAIRVNSAGTSGATGQAWYEVIDPDGNTAYVRAYASK